MASVDSLIYQYLNQIPEGPTKVAIEHLYDILRQTRTRTGGDVDKIYDLELSTIQTWTETSADFTISTPNEGVRVNASATITFPASPDDMFLCAVESQTYGIVTIDGNGKTIQGDSADYLYLPDTTIIYQYFDSLGEWVRR